MKILPLTIDEVIAIAILLLAFLIKDIYPLQVLQGFAAAYLFFCLALRKYAAFRSSKK